MGDIHKFFGKKQLSIEDAFKTSTVSKNSVLTFFENMQSNPTGYGFPEKWNEGTTNAFKNFLNTIKGASSKHSATLLNGPFTLSLTKLDPPNAKFPMYTIFDFIGWIFSAANANPVPDDANEDNFYLPLAAIYAKFCRVLASAYDKDSLTQPHTITLGHFGLNDKGHVILGATIGHPSTVKPQIQEARKKILIDNEVISAKDKKAETWDYGYCAESWFFTYIHARHGVIKEIYGLALNIDRYEKEYVKLMNTTEYDGEKFRASRMGPCGDCRHIIAKLSLTSDHFQPH